MDEACDLQLVLPNNYKVAIGAEKKGENLYTVKDFHELADSPFFASNTLQHKTYTHNGIEFYIWFQGECKPEWDKLIKDFKSFTVEQLEMMEAFPVKVYHFLCQIIPYRGYHGVEHTTSTVIMLGPGYNLMKGITYEDLLGVSSHELFHTWNVKTIRPIEMEPYDYSKENYSKLGYVCEGVTTYYGDLFLYRSGVFTKEQYLKTFAERLQKHFDNFGRYNKSVAESSYDSWLDGYVKGAPNRKTSIYDEGCLLAFITDVFIRRNTKNEKSLDDVMRYLNTEFADKGKGYAEQDYLATIEHFATVSFTEIFESYFNSPADLSELLKEAMAYVGCELNKSPSDNYYAHSIGIKVSELNGVCRVIGLYPDSVADMAGVDLRDEIIAVNEFQVRPEGGITNFSSWCNYFLEPIKEGKEVKLKLTLLSTKKIKQIEITPKYNAYYKTVTMQKMSTVEDDQKINYLKWSKNKF
jgi:predicted metalloprotease with PDZ domain